MSLGLQTLGDIFTGNWSSVPGDISSGWDSITSLLPSSSSSSSSIDNSGNIIGDTNPNSLTPSNPNQDTSGSWWQSPSLWTSVLSTGAGLLTNSQKITADEQARKDALDAQKFGFLVELAKLKYGAHGGGGGRARGGGGGSLANKNQALIDVLTGDTGSELKALGDLSSGYISALK